ncbi:hypothetical protein Hanom_Chr07g00617561 [Helianthus anomalus]
MPRAHLGTAPCSAFFLFLCFGRCCRGVRHATFLPLLCIYVGFGCIFASFVRLSSFNPENTKGRQKHTFSNIST